MRACLDERLSLLLRHAGAADAAPIARPVPSLTWRAGLEAAVSKLTKSFQADISFFATAPIKQPVSNARGATATNYVIQDPLNNLKMLTAHASASSMKISSRVPQGDQQKVLH